MFSSKSAKIFVIAVILTSVFSSCRWWKSLTDPPPPTPFIAQEIPSNIPFQTKEPEIYQTELIISTFTADEKSVQKIFIAKNGLKYFTTFNADEKSAVSSLKTENGNNYLVSDEKKVFTEESQSANSAAATEETLKDFLMTGWLNEKMSAAFENLGTENNVTTFRTKLDSTENTEILVFVDESLKLPVRQEFYSIGREQKNLLFSAEILNFKTETEEKYFELPADYKKVSRKEFDKIVRQDK